DQVFEAGEVDDRDVVDLDVEELLDRLDLQGGAAEGEGSVDFLRRLAGDFGEAVAGDREFVEGPGAGPDQHQRVGPELALFAGLVGRLALFLLFEALLRGRSGPFGVRRPRVGAEDEDRLRVEEQEGVAVEGVLGFARELERLQLGGDGEGEEADEDPADDGDPQPFERPLDGERALRAGAARFPALALAPRQPRPAVAAARPAGSAPARPAFAGAAVLFQARDLGPAQAREQPPPRAVDV